MKRIYELKMISYQHGIFWKNVSVKNVEIFNQSLIQDCLS